MKFTLVFLVVVGFAAAELDWWEGGNFYQIYPRSFMDSNKDGVGDLNGIKAKVKYLKDLGMDGVWLSPIMKSPQADFGYDISDYRDIHGEYGSIADLEALAKEFKANGLKLILDFVPNHSSNEHDWFTKSENREPGYENYYIWHPGTFDPKTGKHIPPNNWVSVFRFSSWTWSTKRKQFYYHAFLKEQPDLNYRNRKLVKEMKDVLTFWLEKGIDGFRIDAVPYLFEVLPEGRGDYPDEPVSGENNCGSDDYCYTRHIYTQDQEETFDMIYQWRALLDSFTKTHNTTSKIIMTEAYTSLDNMIKFYGDGKRNGANVPFNFEVISNVNKDSTAADYFTRINNWLSRVPEGKHANWVLGNHDQHRLATRLGVERTDLLNIMLQTLPGIAVTYQGEEMGLVNTPLTWEQTVDPSACNTQDPNNFERFSRDPCRTPFPWDTTTNAGFSTADPSDLWLPVNPDYETMNVQSQLAAEHSHLKIFMKLTKLRRENVLRQGEYEGKLVNNDNVIIYRRWYGEMDLVVVILNFGSEAATVNVKEAFPEITEDTLPVYTSSLDSSNVPIFTDGSELALNAVEVPANKAVVLKTEY